MQAIIRPILFYFISWYCYSVWNVKHYAIGTRGADAWLQVYTHNVGIMW